MVEFGSSKCTINVIVTQNGGKNIFIKAVLCLCIFCGKKITRMVPAKWKIQKIIQNLTYLQFASGFNDVKHVSPW